jgi:hypothetical protein
MACLQYFLSKNKNPKIKQPDRFIHCGLHDEVSVVSNFQLLQREPSLHLQGDECSVLPLGFANIQNSIRELVGSALIQRDGGADGAATKDSATKVDRLVEQIAHSVLRVDGLKDFKLATQIPWPVEDNTSAGISNQRLTISATRIRDAIFKPYLSQVFRKLESMFETARSTVHVLMTGRLSESPLVMAYFKQTIQDSKWKGKVELLATVNG